MKIQLDVDPGCEETKVTIHCSELDDDIKELLDFLKAGKTDLLTGKLGGKQHLLKPEDVHYFQTSGEHVVAENEKGTFTMKEKLYELEQLLPSRRFIRLSKSVLANLYEISHFEPSFHGTLAVHFKSGAKTYASRHYVSKIKELLNKNRRENK
ncbi:LytTR family transcriptional regulator [Bacillus sp. SB49]|uniref:LytTR family DNA-binding domain-containing protein n=1 Tax=Bacillus sp. SB49 TaxID=1071080 RepID=UPI00040E1922|nr:LytTR family DNA-binding domain-containing protein [Bacillus sp. SB49]QHT46185.1 LytTR family transcriptional regulator [Bacillus sp. SB49]